MTKKLLRIILVVSFVIFAASYIKKDGFPDNTEILDDLYTPPVQTKVYMDAFDIEVEDVVYTIQPLYSYELYGMVVSQHYCGVWWDMYHHDLWKDFINIKDLCVVWGENIETEVYKDMEFSSNSWTCNYRWPNSEVRKRFCKTCLSNNHILSESKTINRLLMDTEVGDQIYLKGYLAQYSHSNNSFNRGTSITRTDTGNEACETIYIEDYEILKKANPQWRMLYTLSKYAVFLSLFLMLAIFIFSKKDTG
jgi:hypothetical protein